MQRVCRVFALKHHSGAIWEIARECEGFDAMNNRVPTKENLGWDGLSSMRVKRWGRRRCIENSLCQQFSNFVFVSLVCKHAVVTLISQRAKGFKQRMVCFRLEIHSEDPCRYASWNSACSFHGQIHGSHTALADNAGRSPLPRNPQFARDVRVLRSDDDGYGGMKNEEIKVVTLREPTPN